MNSIKSVDNSDNSCNEGFVRVSITQFLVNYLTPLGVAEDYIETDIFPYFENGTNHIAVFVAYLQEYGKDIEDLDEKVLEAIVSLLDSLGVKEVVNDISVNLLQWREGKVTRLNLGVDHERRG